MGVWERDLGNRDTPRLLERGPWLSDSAPSDAELENK